MSTEVTPETSRLAHAEKGLARSDKLGPWYGVTVAYLLVSALLLFIRRSEFGLGCEASDPKCGSLQLNDIGDVAAGIFAPLAFLWLFVATQLQRKELRLQRTELADTRRVLAEQQVELERAAKESNQQTKIMQLTLDSSQSKEQYDYFSLNLYYAARVLNEGSKTFLCLYRTETYGGDEPYLTPFSMHICPKDAGRNLSPLDPSTVDFFMDEMYSNIREARNFLLSGTAGVYLGNIDDNAQTLNYIHTAHLTLANAMNDGAIATTDLVKIRVSNLKIAGITQSLHDLHELMQGNLGAELSRIQSATAPAYCEPASTA